MASSSDRATTAAGPPPIMMIHGMWGRPGVWQNFIAHYTGLGYAVEAPALRYHDLPSSDAPTELGRLSLVDYTDDLEAVIRKSANLPILMGHSMGGLIAQILASRGLAQALILLAPAISPGFGGLRPETIRIFRRLFVRWRFWDRPQRLGRDQAIYGLFHRLAPEEGDKQIAAMASESGRVLFEIAFPALDRSHAAEIDIERIRCPVLIVAGAVDRMIPVGQVRRLAVRYGARARYLELPGNAHWLMGEPGWRDIARSCADWLDDVLPGERTTAQAQI